MPKRRLGFREKPYSRRSILRTLASNGSWVVLLRSATWIWVGSIWPPAPPAQTIGILRLWQWAISAALAFTLSIASTTAVMSSVISSATFLVVRNPKCIWISAWGLMARNRSAMASVLVRPYWP